MLRINSPCLRWRSGRWHQQWPSRCFLFFLAQVSQYSIDDVLVLDTGDDPDRSAATATDLDIYVEDAFEPLRPGHGGMTLGGCADFCVGDGLDAFTAPGWRDDLCLKILTNTQHYKERQAR
jgi:hypothetical protein